MHGAKINYERQVPLEKAVVQKRRTLPPTPAAVPLQAVPAAMDPATNLKKISIITLMFLSEISVLSAAVSTTSYNTFPYSFAIVVLSALLLYLIFRYKKIKKSEKHLKSKLDQQNDTLKLNTLEIKELESKLNEEKEQYKNLDLSKKTQEEKRNQLIAAIATLNQSKIEQTMSDLMPEIEKVMIKSFEKGERLVINELDLDMNKKKILTLEKPVLFEDFDGNGKNIFFSPVKGGQQNIGAVIFLLGKNTSTDKVFVDHLNNLSQILSIPIIRKKYEKYTQDFQQNIILSLVNILELHDKNEKGHSERVAKVAVEIGEYLKLPQSEIIQIYWVAMIHDIGKIFLPYALRSKRGRMTAKEFELFQKHSIWGETIIGTNDELEDISRYVRHHHERWDGKGYPDKLERLNIPLISRIIAISDSYDNLRYRSVDAFKNEDDSETLEKIKLNSGKAFDPEIVFALMALKEK